MDFPANENAHAGPDAAGAVENWENEGGHFPELPRAAITPTDVSLAAREPATTGDGATAMRDRFESDLANGPIDPCRDGALHRPGILHRLSEDGRVRDVDPRPDNDT